MTAARLQKSRLLGLGLLALAAVAMLALHRARPELDPIATPISFYIGGAGAWLLEVSLAASGLGVVAIAWSLAERGAPRRAAWLLGISGAGLVLAALAPSDLWFPWQHRLTLAGTIHAGGAAVAVLTFPVGALLVTRAERRTARVALLTRVLDWLLFAFVALLMVFGGITLVYIVMGSTPTFLGFVERLLFTIAVAWLAVASSPAAVGASAQE